MMSAFDRSLKQATLYALALGCARCGSVPNCPLRPIHRLPMSSRFSAADALSPEDKERVLRDHESCLGPASPHNQGNGPLVEALLLLHEIQKRIGTPDEADDDMETAIRSAHDIRNHMARLIAEDDLATG